MRCSVCGNETPLHKAVDEWLRLYDQAQSEPRAVSPERLNDAFTELRRQADASRTERQQDVPSE